MTLSPTPFTPRCDECDRPVTTHTFTGEIILCPTCYAKPQDFTSSGNLSDAYQLFLHQFRKAH